MVSALRVPKVGDRPRSFFDKLNDWAKEQGAPGLGYIIRRGRNGEGADRQVRAAGGAWPR